VDETVEFQPADAGDRAWLGALLERANAGDPGALAGVHEFLDRNPQLWRAVGDLAGHAEAAWTEVIAGGNPLIAGSVKREADRLRGELLGAGASPVEKLLVDQVVVAFLALQWEQMRAAEAPGSTAGQVSARQKRLDGAQRRFAEAVKALAVVRQLVGKADARTRLRVFQAEGSG
jgi:hypothetical protein